MIFEVFRRERKGQAFEHAGSVAAPDLAFAEAYAHEQYGRRGESAALWVVPRDSIHEIDDFPDELGRNYHRVDGYSLKVKLTEARERAGTAARRSLTTSSSSAGATPSGRASRPCSRRTSRSRRSRRTRSATRARSTSCCPTTRTRSRSTARPAEYRCAPLVQLRFVPDWARTIARHVLYEAADELRIEQLKASDDTAVAGLAAKIDREEVYHRLHAQMWADRLRDEPRYREAIDELWPYAVAMLERGPPPPAGRPLRPSTCQVTVCYLTGNGARTSTTGRRSGTR